MITTWHAASDFTQQLLDFLARVEGNHYEARDVGDGNATKGVSIAFFLQQSCHVANALT